MKTTNKLNKSIHHILFVCLEFVDLKAHHLIRNYAFRSYSRREPFFKREVRVSSRKCDGTGRISAIGRTTTGAPGSSRAPSRSSSGDLRSELSHAGPVGPTTSWAVGSAGMSVRVKAGFILHFGALYICSVFFV